MWVARDKGVVGIAGEVIIEESVSIEGLKHSITSVNTV
jgi:hypothetical protein